MMIIANGMPKSGTHALLKGVELLGIPANFDSDHKPGWASLAHLPADAKRPKGKIVYITRHPRNVLISWVRAHGQPLTQGHLIAAMTAYGYDHIGMANTCDAYAGWLRDSSVHRVRYEDLLSDDSALRAIASFLDVPYLEDAFANLPGLTRTWSGAPSDWTQVWTSAVDDAWAAAGMPARERAMGY